MYGGVESVSQESSVTQTLGMVKNVSTLKPKPVKVAGFPLSSLQQLMDIKDSDNFYFKDTKKGGNILNELIDFQDTTIKRHDVFKSRAAQARVVQSLQPPERGKQS